MKVLTVCQGGNVRSTGLKYRLKYKYGHEALACGWEANDLETRKMLYEWADVIVIMQAEFEKYVPEEYRSKNGKRKLYCYDVGEDRFMNPFHPELQAMLETMIQKHKLFL